MIEAVTPSAMRRRPAVIAHRGASGYRPEHTLAAYALAIDQGADFIEPDLVVTRDGVLVARHENELSRTTDVAERPEFCTRRTRKLVDGKSVEGWFSEDFSLDELKALRAREPSPDSRPCSAAFDGCFEIPTLQEIVDLLSTGERRSDAAATTSAPARLRCGLYMELKHPTFYVAQGFHTAPLLVETLRSNGLAHERERVFIQSFEIGTLKQLRRLTDLPLVQLLDVAGGPYDSEAAGGGRTYRDLTTAAGLAGIATYADAIGPAKALVAPRSADGGVDQSAALLEDAQRLGLLVHVWTFRLEDGPRRAHRLIRQPMDREAAEKDLADELRRYLATGLDGLFTDNPDVAVRTRTAIFGG
jgi:glycerophosphoryl diester phosphodiesterase